MIFNVACALFGLQALISWGVQVEGSAVRRTPASGGHSARVAYVIRGLLDSRDSSGNMLTERQAGTCGNGFYDCIATPECCPIDQICDTAPDGSPTCCCSPGGGNCKEGFLPCAGNESVCCPQGQICTSDGRCLPANGPGGTSSSSGSGSETTGASAGASSSIASPIFSPTSHGGTNTSLSTTASATTSTTSASLGSSKQNGSSGGVMSSMGLPIPMMALVTMMICGLVVSL